MLKHLDDVCFGGLIISVTFSCSIFFSGKKIRRHAKLRVKKGIKRFSRKKWSVVLRIESVRVESNGVCYY